MYMRVREANSTWTKVREGQCWREKVGLTTENNDQDIESPQRNTGNDKHTL